ncbi:hypothetical protein ACWEWX_52650, partial [Streptomyces asiaticus]
VQPLLDGLEGDPHRAGDHQHPYRTVARPNRSAGAGSPAVPTAQRPTGYPDLPLRPMGHASCGRMT